MTSTPQTNPAIDVNGETPTLRLFALLELIAGKDEFVSLQGLAEETGMPKPTLHRMLQQWRAPASCFVRAVGAITGPARACAGWRRTSC